MKGGKYSVRIIYAQAACAAEIDRPLPYKHCVAAAAVRMTIDDDQRCPARRSQA